jgi:hypothetical protein
MARCCWNPILSPRYEDVAANYMQFLSAGRESYWSLMVQLSRTTVGATGDARFSA